jgi:hypothetical protein
LSTRVRALQTLERYLGWPTLLQAVSTMRAAGPARWTVPAFGETLSELMGIDVRALVENCFSNAPFDYSLEHLDSHPGAAGLIETTLEIVNHGSGRFVIGGNDHDAAVPLVVRFADGTMVRDDFDGGAASSATPLTLIYSAKAAATSASIDPDAMLLLDTNRGNNSIVKDAPTSRLGIRLALHWLAWLQNAMLSYTAVL